MSLDKLAVIFIIIILPISVVLHAYTDYQVETLNLQISYDQKLNDSTKDAIKAYQLNAFNESTSDLSVSKMRDITAAGNAFFNSLSANFNMSGYDKATLQEYVPALVFTMYDGYYIYSKYTNNIIEGEEYSKGGTDESGERIDPSTYQGGELLYGINPFVSYSCRYKTDENNDFVISYTLDNYISIQGIIDGKWVHDGGYLIDVNKTIYNPGNSLITYRGKEIKPEPILEEKIGTKTYKYQKVNGVKYYFDPDHKNKLGQPDPKWFSLLNGVKNYIKVSYNKYYDYSAYNYYKDAYDFTLRLKNEYKIQNIVIPENAYDNEGTKISDMLTQTDKNLSIFNSNSNTFAEDIEIPSSRFNQHRLAIIKYTIEKNLSIAIKNYNKFKGAAGGTYVEADFQMPKLNATEWDKIQNNITLISFLQGLPIGGKIYNGVCVVPNNKNDEIVTENSIYLGNTSTKHYYNPLYKEFEGTESLQGVLNVDLERRGIEPDETESLIGTNYYYPKYYEADYDSIIAPTKNVSLNAEPGKETVGYSYAYNGNIYKYMQENAKDNVATEYFTALARERYSTYKINEPYRIPKNVKIFQGNNHKYYLFKKSDIKYYSNLITESLTETTLTWHEAEAYCESLGGHLVTINSDREQAFIEDELLKKENGLDSGDEEIWVGYEEEGSTKKWITGEEATGKKFLSVFPEWPSYEFQGHFDDDDDKSDYFICEWEI